MPATVLDAVFASQENRRVVRTLLLPASRHEKGLTPTDEQLKAYYEANQARFEQPESVDISYVVLRRDAMLPADAQPSDGDLKTFYAKHAGRFNQPAEREASHILLKWPEGADDAAKAKVREQAEALLAQARANPDGFAELARKHSQDTGSAAEGGSLGYFERDTMVKPFADAAFALDKPGLTDVVESEFGYHVIKVTGIKGGGEKPLAEVRDELLKMWREEEAARRYTPEAEALSMARLCYHLGNRHVPLQIGPGLVRYLHDHVLDELVRGMGLAVLSEHAPFEPEAGAYRQVPHVHE